MGSRVQNVRWSFGFFMIILHFGSFWAICCKSFEETKTVNLNPWCRLLGSHIFLLLSPFPETNVCINRRKSSPTISYCCSHVVAHPINLDLRLAAARSIDMLCGWWSYPNKSSQCNGCFGFFWRWDCDPLKDLLNIGEDHLGVDPVVIHHGEHVLRSQKVWYPG